MSDNISDDHGNPPAITASDDLVFRPLPEPVFNAYLLTRDVTCPGCHRQVRARYEVAIETPDGLVCTECAADTMMHAYRDALYRLRAEHERRQQHDSTGDFEYHRLSRILNDIDEAEML
ncbi:hypothetical protein [Mycobacterium sp. E787]|uniref:hypothetical protein n=1 Tax=Mycobacterium sp. E787 TaxID=1834150 RepID=UPI0007FFFF08|nr:hypothetical protein [Mycobacterium sp. E787]OBI52875.1 hypothetical protein A5705_04885 [Mycobacterium sp. E787]